MISEDNKLETGALRRSCDLVHRGPAVGAVAVHVKNTSNRRINRNGRPVCYVDTLYARRQRDE